MSSSVARLLGITQGRIQPAGWVAPLGDFVMCLGSDLAGDFQDVADTDTIYADQTADVTSIKVIRFSALIRPAGEIANPGTLVGWQFQWGIVGDGLFFTRKLTSFLGKPKHLTEPRTFTSLIPCAHLFGNQTIRFQLLFIE